MTHDANEVTWAISPPATVNTGIIPASVFTSPNNGMLFVWVSAAGERPSIRGWFMGAFGLFTGGLFWPEPGRERSGDRRVECAAGWGFRFLPVGGLISRDLRGQPHRQRLANGLREQRGGPPLPTPLAAGLGGREPIFILAKDADSVPTNFSDATLSAAGVGQNFSSSDMAQLIADVLFFETGAGRTATGL